MNASPGILHFPLRLAQAILLTAALSAGFGSSANAATEPLNAIDGIAMDGFDVVAYFRVGKPVKGIAEHAVEYQGSNWVFSSAANADAFRQDPEAYAPQFNGWCAYAVSQGYGAEVDFIDGWSILDDKLYLNWSKGVRDDFIANQAALKPRAKQNWPQVRSGIIDGSIEIARHKRYFGVGIKHAQQL